MCDCHLSADNEKVTREDHLINCSRIHAPTPTRDIDRPLKGGGLPASALWIQLTKQIR